LIAAVYGFGSYFKGAATFRDIDILVVHNSNSYESCLDAISLKRAIITTIDGVDVSMLSQSEEQNFNFIDKSQAFLLYEYKGGNKGFAAKEILEKVQAHKNITKKFERDFRFAPAPQFRR